jgi:protein-disulfide isomerase
VSAMEAPIAPTLTDPLPSPRKRLAWLAPVVLVVTAAIAALVVSGAGNTPPPLTQAARTDRAVDALLKGIPQNGNHLGARSAPVTLFYFGDLECPFCREFTLGALPTLIARWVRPGRLQIIYLAMETATRDPTVFKLQQVAALAAGRQDRMWYYLELFYHEQGREDSGYVTERYLRELAQQVPGLNLTQWRRDRGEARLATQVEESVKLARHLRLPGTPALFLGPTGGHASRYEPASLSDPDGFNEQVQRVLAEG